MTATAVIEEIKQLSPAEQSRVIRFAVELARQRQVSGEKISALARQMADSDNPAEVQKLREEIHRGFYGEWPCRKFGATMFRRTSSIICLTASAGAIFPPINSG
jgi:hypothetical protein